MNTLEKLIQKLCPNGVEYKPLRDVCVIKNGRDYKTFGSGPYPVYGSGGIMTYVDHYVYDKPTVLIPRKGSIENIFYVEGAFWNVDTIFYTEIKTDVVIPKYLYYWLFPMLRNKKPVAVRLAYGYTTRQMIWEVVDVVEDGGWFVIDLGKRLM